MTDEEKSTRLTRAYKRYFGGDDPEGNMILADLKSKAGFDLSIVPLGTDEHIDIYQVMRNEGQRSVIIHILRQVAKDLDKTQQTETIDEGVQL